MMRKQKRNKSCKFWRTFCKIWPSTASNSGKQWKENIRLFRNEQLKPFYKRNKIWRRDVWNRCTDYIAEKTRRHDRWKQKISKVEKSRANKTTTTIDFLLNIQCTHFVEIFIFILYFIFIYFYHAAHTLH